MTTPTSSHHRAEVAVVTRDRAVILERYCLPGLLEIAETGARVRVFDQSDDGDTEWLLAPFPIMYVRVASRGLAAGRNEALRMATSEWVLFTDDDVVPSWHWFSSTLTVIDACPHAAAILGRGRRPDGSLMRGGEPGEHTWPTDPFSLGSGYSLALRRSAALTVGGFDPEFGAGARFGAAEDTMILYRLLVSGNTVVCTDEVELLHPDWRAPREEVWRQFRYGGGTAALVAISRSAVVRQFAARRLRLQATLVRESTRRRRWGEALARAGYLAGYSCSYPYDKLVLALRRFFRHQWSHRIQ